MKKLVLLPVCLGAYLAWPCVALYHMDAALQRGNTRALATAVEWDSVREGLKEDIADGIMGTDPTATAAADDASADALPPFGASFVKGMAGNAVDRIVTPERLAAEFGASRGAAALTRKASSFAIWFDSPTRFEASLRLGSKLRPTAPLRLQLDLVRVGWGWQWHITRAFVPTEVFAELGDDSLAEPPATHKVFAGQ